MEGASLSICLLIAGFAGLAAIAIRQRQELDSLKAQVDATAVYVRRNPPPIVTQKGVTGYKMHGEVKLHDMGDFTIDQLCVALNVVFAPRSEQQTVANTVSANIMTILSILESHGIDCSGVSRLHAKHLAEVDQYVTEKQAEEENDE